MNDVSAHCQLAKAGDQKGPSEKNENHAGEAALSVLPAELPCPKHTQQTRRTVEIRLNPKGAHEAAIREEKYRPEAKRYHPLKRRGEIHEQR